MKLQTTAMIEKKQLRSFAHCAQCGAPIIGPEWSEHLSERCVRHFWSCDACGYEFETSIYLPGR
jgi:ribosomal protein L37AE/L43A